MVESLTRTITVFRDDGSSYERDTTLGSQIAEHLRPLPGAYVTKEMGDDKKAHAMDDPQTAQAIALNAEIAERKKDYERNVVADEGQLPFTQYHIDCKRISVIRAILSTGPDVEQTPIYHLWFAKPSFLAYELRQGQAPRDIYRPPHLRGKHLDINLLDVEFVNGFAAKTAKATGTPAKEQQRATASAYANRFREKRKNDAALKEQIKRAIAKVEAGAKGDDGEN